MIHAIVYDFKTRKFTMIDPSFFANPANAASFPEHDRCNIRLYSDSMCYATYMTSRYFGTRAGSHTPPVKVVDYFNRQRDRYNEVMQLLDDRDRRYYDADLLTLSKIGV